MSYMSPANEHFIQEELATGAYSDREQLIDEAIDLLRRRRELKRMIAQGIAELDRGEGIPEEEVFAELEAMADEIVREAQEKQEPDALLAIRSPGLARHPRVHPTRTSVDGTQSD